MPETHAQCPVCLGVCNREKATVVCLPCGHDYHMQCVADISAPFCEADDTCAAQTHQLRATQMAQDARLNRNVRVISAADCHNWLPSGKRRYNNNNEADTTPRTGRPATWLRILNRMAAPLFAYSNLEQEIAVYDDGDILRQLQDGRSLSQLRGENNQIVNSLQQLVDLMGPATSRFFFPNLQA